MFSFMMRLSLRQTYPDFVIIRSGGVILRVNTDEINWVQAARNSVTVHLNGESIVLKSPLNKIVPQLNDGNFIRIHRSTIINVNRIRELRYGRRGTFQVFLQDGTQLLLSKRYRINFLNFLRLPLN
jgi:two-component system, LytTR family, response regulator